MTLSNAPDAVARFWRNYRILLTKSGVKPGPAEWYVRHAEAYLKAFEGRRLATHAVAEVEGWLAERGRIGRLQPWQFGQVVEAVRLLLQLAQAPAAAAVDWGYWREAGRELPATHPTLARSAALAPIVGAVEGGDGADALRLQLVAVIRQRNYSIRTEEAYCGWLDRFARFLKGADPRTAGAVEVKAFLQELAVHGRVAASTQNQALNALVFFYDKVLERPLGELESFARAKRPQRLPVVLAREEVVRLLARMDGVHGMMAALLYGTGMRLMECMRLRVKDLDFEYRQIVVRDGKGHKCSAEHLPPYVSAKVMLSCTNNDRSMNEFSWS